MEQSFCKHCSEELIKKELSAADIVQSEQKDFLFPYTERYMELYEKIQSGTLNAKGIIDTQFEIFNTIETLKKSAKNKKLYKIINFEYLYDVWRMLANNILDKYIFNCDPIVIRKLSLNDYRQDNYDSIHIKRYLEIAYEFLEEMPGALMVITDLCLGSIKWGDIIRAYGNEIKGVEIKSGTPKNLQIMNAVETGNINRILTKYDEKQFRRIQKQFIRMDEISKVMSEKNIYVMDDGVLYPYFLDGISSYKAIFREEVVKPCNLFRNVDVDDCISFSINNTSGQNMLMTCKENELICCMCKYGDELNAWAENHYKYNEVENADVFVITYNEVLRNPYFPQPSSLNISADVIREMLNGSKAIQISINIEKLFEAIRQHGYKVYPKKTQEKPSDFVYKQKRWIIQKNDIKNQFSYMLINRIAFACYSTKGILQFIDMMFAFYEICGDCNGDA